MVSELREAIDSRQGRPEVVQSRKTESAPVQSAAPTSSTGQLLTTGEAYEVLKGKGFDKSINTLRRSLADALQSGALPESLARYGLLADFEVRRNANPKDNRVKWLYFT